MEHKTKSESLHTEIVVIGAGGAGFAAAVAAAETGVKEIVLLEKAENPGGNTLSFVGCIFAVNSPTQRRLGINISADEVFREKMAMANWEVDPRIMRAVINQSGYLIQWLEDKGLEFKDIIVFRPEDDCPRVSHDINPGHMGDTGKAVIETLNSECQRLGVKLLCNTPAVKILLNENGSVKGVMAETGGEKFEISARSVIIAAGGFGNNKELVERFFPSHKDVFCHSKPQCTGDGVMMAEDVGAIVDDQLAASLVGPEYSGTKNLNVFLRRPDVMIVNKYGRRFFDESIYLHSFMDVTGKILSRQPDKICYALLDSDMLNSIVEEQASLSSGGKKEEDIISRYREAESGLDEVLHNIKREETTGIVKVSDSWDEVAKWIGVKPAILKKTIDEYNYFCDMNYDNDFLKDKRYLHPLLRPPFYAISGRQAINTTFGGIKINYRMEVLDRKHQPIRGLYAAGDNAGSWASKTYSHRYAGTPSSFALCSGYISGVNAARYTLGIL